MKRVRSQSGDLFWLCLFLAIDRRKFQLTQCFDTVDRQTVVPFLKHLRARQSPTDKGIQVVDQPRNRNRAGARQMRSTVTGFMRPYWATAPTTSARQT